MTGFNFAFRQRAVLEERDFAVARDLRVVGQANVEEHRVFSRREGMQVVRGGTHVQQRVRLNGHQAGALGFDRLFGSQHLVVFVVTEIVVLILVGDLVIAKVLELAENESEEHGHVGVVVEWHRCSLLDEEHHEFVVLLGTVDDHTVQWAVEVVGVV